MKYRNFEIAPKLDFGKVGHYIGGKYIKTGHVVTDGFCNVLPGATWARTPSQARDLIDAHIESQGDAETFWGIVKKQNEVKA